VVDGSVERSVCHEHSTLSSFPADYPVKAKKETKKREEMNEDEVTKQRRCAPVRHAWVPREPNQVSCVSAPLTYYYQLRLPIT
jgi:hypothetical protein